MCILNIKRNNLFYNEYEYFTSCDIRHPCIELAAKAKRLFDPSIVSFSQIGDDK